MVCNEFSLLVSPVMPFHRPPVLAEKNALSLHCISLPHAPNPELWGRHSASAKPVFWAIFLKQLSNHMICWGKVPSKCLCFQHSLCACLFIAWKNYQIFKCIFRIYAHIGVSIQRLLCDIPKFAYKYVDGNITSDFLGIFKTLTLSIKSKDKMTSGKLQLECWMFLLSTQPDLWGVHTVVISHIVKFHILVEIKL